MAQMVLINTILPTLVELCHLKANPGNPGFDGISLKSLLMGTSGSIDDRVLIESFRRVVMTQRWRLVDERELYDIQKDPAQREVVSGNVQLCRP
jgi:hypothetical protein